MALFEPIEAKPVLGIEDGKIVLAATVTAKVIQFGRLSYQVVTWRAGRGQEVDYLSPAEFSTWRRSFAVPEVAN